MTYDKGRQRDVGLALGAGYLVLIAGAVLGKTPVMALAALVTFGLEYVAYRRCGNLIGFLGGIGFPTATRQLWRDAAVVLTVIQTAQSSTAANLGVLGVVLSAHVVAMAKGAAAVVIGRRHLLPIETRDIDLTRLALPQPPAAWAMGFGRAQLLNLNIALVPAAILADLNDSVLPVLLAGCLSTVVGLVTLVALLPGLLRSFAVPPPAAMVAEVGRQLARYAPTVALYQAGDPESLYQLQMWLDPVEAAGERAVVIVRNRRTMAALRPVPFPVLCVPNGTHLIALPLPTIRVALYPSNAGPNIHLLREPGMRHVFVGHGDSDKMASINPFSKVYNEVWVAGPAGRERYLRADVGVRDEDVVEVGRPQLAAVRPGGPLPPGGPLTVLYAPTWEGWGDDPHHSSLTTMGERIVRGLLDSPVPVRIIYKPHPLTGTQSPRAEQAHRRVVALLRGQRTPSDQAARRGSPGPWRHLRDLAEWLVVPHAAQGDAAAASTDPCPPAGIDHDDGDPDALGESTPDMSMVDRVGHRVVTGSAPTLHECMNQADILIADVSSVVADWIQSQKPYLVANCAGRAEAQFRRAYPTASAAFLLSKDCADLDKFLRLVAEGNDPMADARRSLKHYLLGPDEPPPLRRFAAEIARGVAGHQPSVWHAVAQPGSVDGVTDLASTKGKTT